MSGLDERLSCFTCGGQIFVFGTPNPERLPYNLKYDIASDSLWLTSFRDIFGGDEIVIKNKNNRKLLLIEFLEYMQNNMIFVWQCASCHRMYDYDELHYRVLTNKMERFIHEWT